MNLQSKSRELSTKMLRRDQIWFTEKNRPEQTDLYCLTDIVLPDGTIYVGGTAAVVTEGELKV